MRTSKKAPSASCCLGLRTSKKAPSASCCLGLPSTERAKAKVKVSLVHYSFGELNCTGSECVLIILRESIHWYDCLLNPLVFCQVVAFDCQQTISGVFRATQYVQCSLQAHHATINTKMVQASDVLPFVCGYVVHLASFWYFPILVQASSNKNLSFSSLAEGTKSSLLHVRDLLPSVYHSAESLSFRDITSIARGRSTQNIQVAATCDNTGTVPTTLGRFHNCLPCATLHIISLDGRLSNGLVNFNGVHIPFDNSHNGAICWYVSQIRLWPAIEHGIILLCLAEILKCVQLITKC